MHFKTKSNLYTSGDIKREAKVQLTGYWGGAVILGVIPAIFSFFFLREAADNTLIGITFDLIRDFLVTGMTFAFMNLLRQPKYRLDPLQEIVSPFRSEYFVGLLKIKLWQYLFVFLWALLFVIPGIVKAYGYSQAELIYKDTVDRTGKQPDARACIKESQKRMYGYKADLFALDLSFIGWLLLNGFTFGLLGLWLTPYMQMSRVVFYENLTNGYYLNREDAIHTQTSSEPPREPINKYEEVGKDPDDFRDFEDF